MVRPQGFEPRLQAPEACVISLSPRAPVFAIKEIIPPK